MSNEVTYMGLPFDLAGSRSKNRFRYEMLWGLSKIFEIYNSHDSFVMVFDYACDIEIHTEMGFDFYQVKSKKDGASYTQGALLKKKKTKNENRSQSILGRLYLLANNTNDNIHVSLVSNKPFQDSNKYDHTTIEVLDFKKLDDTVKEDIGVKLKEELKLDIKPDISKLSFIFTSIDLLNPDDTLRGKTTKFFLDATGEEPNKPNALYNLLVSMISERACYELKLDCYEDIIGKKGISKSDINTVLSIYSEKIDIAVERASKYIDANINKAIKKSKLKAELSKLISDMKGKNVFLIQIEEKIVHDIYSNEDRFDVEPEEFIEILFSGYSTMFPIEYSERYRYVFFLLILMKVEENVYEQFSV